MGQEPLNSAPQGQKPRQPAPTGRHTAAATASAAATNTEPQAAQPAVVKFDRQIRAGASRDGYAAIPATDRRAAGHWPELFIRTSGRANHES